MENYQILTPGAKIRYIRTRYKIRQHEITGGQITRNLISIIENDKANLTTQVADIIATNINLACKERGIDFQTTADYLLEDVKTQVVKVANKYMEYLEQNEKSINDDFDEKVKEIEKLLMKYDTFETKVKVYSKIADIYLYNKEYQKAYTFYVKAYENSSRLEDELTQLSLLTSLSFCCSMLGRYRQLLDYNLLALSSTDTIPIEKSLNIRINNAIAYKKLSKIDKAIEEIQFIQNHFALSKDDEFDILTLKANCLKNKSCYNEALNLQKSLLASVSNSEIERKLIVLSNIMEIYTIFDDTISLKKCLDYCYSLISEYTKLESKPYCSEVYNSMALANKVLRDINASKKYFNMALQACRQYKNPLLLTNIFENLIDIHRVENNTTELNLLKNELLESIALNILPCNNVATLRLIECYNDWGDQLNIKSILNFILNNTGSLG